MLWYGSTNLENKDDYTELINKYTREGNITKFSCSENAIKYNNPNGRVSSIKFTEI